jgi:hypothetical protein
VSGRARAGRGGEEHMNGEDNGESIGYEDLLAEMRHFPAGRRVLDELAALRAARIGVCANCYHVDAVYFDGEADVCVRFDVCQSRQQVGRR